MIFISLPIIIGLSNGSPEVGMRNIKSWITNSVVAIINFYIVYLIFIPGLLEKKKYTWFAFAFIAFLGLFPFVSIGIRHIMGYLLNSDFNNTNSSLDLGRQYIGSFFFSFFITFVSVAGRFTFDWFKNIQIQADLKSQNLNSELALLKSQISPHFLFNTLNNIHTLVYKKSDNAHEAVMKLSSLMRYVLYESDDKKVEASKEMDYLKSYIELEKLRMTNPEQVAFNMEGDYHTKKIAPMILIPFIENAFKHSNKNREGNYIKVSLDYNSETLRFTCENSFQPKTDETKDKTGGIGLKNVSRRLELIYPNNYQLEVSENNNIFKVDLSLNLN